MLPHTLNILAGLDMHALGHNTPAMIHTVIEALKLAFADRHRHYGDPKFVDVPMQRLLGTDHAARQRRQIDATRAADPLAEATGDVWREPALDTSYICVVDRWGNAFSATPSDGCFDGLMIPGTGLCPSARGAQSWTDPSHPSCLAPGKRPRLTCSPALAARGGDWVMPFGTPGDDVQPQAMVQFLLNHLVFGLPPQAAIDAPRFATFGYPCSSEPHQHYPRRISLERRLTGATADALSALGHEVAWWRDWEWRAGGLCAVAAERARGTMEGGADRRRPGGGVAGLLVGFVNISTPLRPDLMRRLMCSTTCAEAARLGAVR